MHENDQGIHRLHPLKHTTRSAGEQRTRWLHKNQGNHSIPVSRSDESQPRTSYLLCTRTSDCSLRCSCLRGRLQSDPGSGVSAEFWLRCPRSLAPSTLRKSRPHPPDGVNKTLTLDLPCIISVDHLTKACPKL